MTKEKNDTKNRMFHWASAERPALSRKQLSFQSPPSRNCCCTSFRKRYRRSSGEPTNWRRSSESAASSYSQQFDTESVTSATSTQSYTRPSSSKINRDNSPEAEVARHVRQFLSRTLFPPSPPVPLMGYSSLYERLKKPALNANQKLENRVPMLPSVNYNKKISLSHQKSKRTSQERDIFRSDSLPSPAKRKSMLEPTHKPSEGAEETLTSELSDSSSSCAHYLGDDNIYTCSPKCHIHIYLPEQMFIPPDEKF